MIGVCCFCSFYCRKIDGREFRRRCFKNASTSAATGVGLWAGAVTGAAVGSAIPVAGTLVGGIIGFLVSALAAGGLAYGTQWLFEKCWPADVCTVRGFRDANL